MMLPVKFAAATPAGTDLGTIVAAPLGERTTDSLFTDAVPAGEVDGVRLFTSSGLRIGLLRAVIGPTALPELTERLYRRMFAACGERRLYRIWNYVPQINAQVAGLENYRAFCVGRSRAFETALGAGYKSQLPAASAVGCGGNELVVMFAAGDAEPRHVENPAQVPAYEYPPEHGPRSPSFARATLAAADGRRHAFISGTAAIRGHETVAPGAFDAQLACTLENLRLIADTAGLGRAMTLPGACERHFKVYLREAGDYAKARAQLEQSLFRPGDAVLYLQAEICRAALDVEIEATLIGR